MLHDQASRDEALMREDQLRSAGGAHHVVESMPALGAGAPQAGGEAALRSQYEECLGRERRAWAAVLSAGGASSGVAWENWRDAVEARDRATRALINHALAAAGPPDAAALPDPQ